MLITRKKTRSTLHHHRRANMKNNCYWLLKPRRRRAGAQQQSLALRTSRAVTIWLRSSGRSYLKRCALFSAMLCGEPKACLWFLSYVRSGSTHLGVNHFLMVLAQHQRANHSTSHFWMTHVIGLSHFFNGSKHCWTPEGELPRVLWKTALGRSTKELYTPMELAVLRSLVVKWVLLHHGRSMLIN